jgi:phospholipid/cholesterol/gamma-HCH transport system substrate-binding protein
LKVSKEIKTAIFVICSVLLFYWGYSFLKGKDILSNYKTFYVQYENVEGLTASSPITINGHKIGTVKSIKFNDMSSWKPIVELQIDEEYDLSKSCIARLYEPGLIGGKQIQIITNPKDTSIAESGSFLKGDVQPGLTDLVSEKLAPLQEKVEKAMVSADDLLVNFNSILDDKTKKNLQSSIASLDEVLIEMKTIAKSANQLLADNKSKIDNSLTNFETMSTNFASLSDSLSEIKLKQTVENLENTLANVDKIMEKLEAGEGTMGKLLKDEKMYQNFTAASKELELLLQDLRLYPTRYVNVSLFGKKNKPYVAPTEVDSTQTKN